MPEPFLKQVLLNHDQIVSFDAYPFSIPAVRHLKRMDLHPAVTFFVGENATGKSTLLEAIAVAEGLNGEGGGRNFDFKTRATHSDLATHLRFIRGIRRLSDSDSYFLRAESFYNVATEVETLRDVEPQDADFIFRNYGVSSLHESSHGESFFALLCKRFRGNGLYLLDEPEAALSPARQLSVLARIDELVKLDSQFLIATHSPILLAYPNAWIYQFADGPLKRVEYTETEHYKISRAFLNRFPKMLEDLLGH